MSMRLNKKMVVTKIFLLVVGNISLFSYLMYTISGGEKWFSRLLLAVICYGFHGVISAIEEKF